MTFGFVRPRPRGRGGVPVGCADFARRPREKRERPAVKERDIAIVALIAAVVLTCPARAQDATSARAELAAEENRRAAFELHAFG